MKKKIKLILSSLVMCPLLVTASAIASTNTNKKIMASNSLSVAKNGYFYNNEFFPNIESVATRYLVEHPGTIQNGYYVGDLNHAILDPSTGLVNINDLRRYDDSKLFPAYVDALGNHTYDYQKAKKSYVNPGLIRYKYYDFNGNLFASPEEAKESIINSKHPTGVQYYEGNLFSKYRVDKFNPLSKNDLQEFKKCVFNEIQNKVLNPQYQTDYALKLYDLDYFNNTTSQWELSSKNKSIRDDENYLNDIISDILSIYTDTMLEFIKSQRFDVKIKLVNHGKGNITNYEIKNFASSNLNYRCVDEKNLEFDNVNFDDLLKFNTFINRKDFEGHSKLWTHNCKHGIAYYYVADEAKVTFLDTTFDLIYCGNDKGDAKGIDIEILRVGKESTQNSYLGFNVKPSFSEKNSLVLNNTFRSIFEQNIKKLFVDSSPNSIRYQITKSVLELVYDMLFSKNIAFNTEFEYYDVNDGDVATSKEITDLDKNIVVDNKFLKESCSNILEASSRNILAKNYQLKNLQITDMLFNLFRKSNNIKLVITKTLNNLNPFVIDYHNKPLFKIKLNINDNKNDLIIRQAYANGIAINLGLKNAYIFNSKIDSITPKIKTEIIDKISNVSQSFETINNSFNVLNDMLLITNDGYNWKFNDSSKEFNPTYNSIIPEIKNGVDIAYPLNTIVNTYNKNIDSLKLSNPRYQEIIKNEYVDPSEVVILYKENLPMDTKYREFLSNGRSVSPALIGNNSLKLLNNKDEIKKVIENTTITEPQKVVVLYDLLGNVINPGIKLNPDETISTSSDAIFDSEQTIIDNIMRTKLIPIDIDKVFYKNQDDTFTLLDYRISQIYTLKIENKIYNYDTHEDCFKELCNYVKKFVEVSKNEKN